MLKLSIAFSPCPNDTFLFHALVNGHTTQKFKISVELKDISKLNESLLYGNFDLIKGSYSLLPNVMDRYFVLPVGSALGYGNGPKIVAKAPFTLTKLPSKSIAVPSKSTTAFHLLNCLCPSPKEVVEISYEKILGAVIDSTVDSGLIIHESRFLFQKYGCVEIEDLGLLWEKEKKLPLPLGAIYVKKSLEKKHIQLIVEALSESQQIARKAPHLSLEYVLKHAQEKEISIVQKHIETYVTRETEHLSDEGIKAVMALFEKEPQIQNVDNWLFK